MAPVTRRSNGLAPKTSVKSTIPKNVLVELSVGHGQACMLCFNKEISEKSYGKLYQLNDVIVHYFCILLSSLAVQNGTDKEGIWGFLLKDIKSELDRGLEETCFYCKKKGATISCCGLKCRKSFHLPCGLKNGSMHQFFQSFKSYCRQHRITQTIDISELQSTAPVQCSICKDDVIPSPLPSSIWAPCCKRNAWFHRNCVQELALSAGYFFKCPLCNNVDVFKSRMLTLGIYIPSRDASWETVPNAFAELLERHSTCNAPTCLCPHQEKRKYHNEAGSWEIILCYTCGSNGTHRLCSSIKCDQGWFCVSCQDIADKANKSKKRQLELPNNGGSSGISIMFEENLLSQRRENAGRLVQTTSRCINSRPQSNDEPILISDDDDSGDSSDSSVQCITYIDPPRSARVIPMPQMQLPRICGYASINRAVPRNRMRRRCPLSANRSRNLIYIPGSIDLTSDDDNDA